MPTQYHQVILDLSEDQLHKLVNSQSIRLKPEHIFPTEGGLPVCLTTTQLNKLQKAQSSGKGAELRFSKARIKACLSYEGGGIFSDALKKVGAFGKSLLPQAKQLAGHVASKYAPVAVDKIADVASNALKDIVSDDFKPFLELGMDLGKRFSKSQLEGIIDHIRVGSGLYQPGASVSRRSRRGN